MEPKKESGKNVEVTPVTTIADCLEELNVMGFGYDEEAANFLLDYLSERGYAIKDVATGKAA